MRDLPPSAQAHLHNMARQPKRVLDRMARVSTVTAQARDLSVAVGRGEDWGVWDQRRWDVGDLDLIRWALTQPLNNSG